MTESIAAPRPLTLDVGAVETSGLALHEQADGTLRVTAQRFAVRQLEVRNEAGALDFASVAVIGLAARLAKPAESGLARIIDGAADEVRIEGMNAFVNEAPIGAAAERGLRLDALADLDGVVRAFLTDALWIIDAEIVVPLARGTIDFNGVVVEHIGPNSSMSIGPRSIHIDAPNRARVDLFTFPRQGVPGASPEAPSPARRRDRGRLELAPFLRAVLGTATAPTSERLVKLAAPDLERPLRGARVAGDLNLGDGALGTDTHHAVLTGRAAGRNRIEVAAPVLGERLVLRAPKLAASAATLALGGRALAMGSVDAAVELHVIANNNRSGNGRDSLSLAIAVRDAALHHVKLV